MSLPRGLRRCPEGTRSRPRSRQSQSLTHPISRSTTNFPQPRPAACGSICPPPRPLPTRPPPLPYSMRAWYQAHAPRPDSALHPNFLELRYGEVRRIPLPRTPVNRPQIATNITANLPLGYRYEVSRRREGPSCAEEVPSLYWPCGGQP